LEDWGNWKIACITGDFTAQSLIDVKSLFDSIEKSKYRALPLIYRIQFSGFFGHSVDDEFL